jgi:hypothetical protein
MMAKRKRTRRQKMVDQILSNINPTKNVAGTGVLQKNEQFLLH